MGLMILPMNQTKISLSNRNLLRKGINKQDVLTRLFKYTELQDEFWCQ